MTIKKINLSALNKSNLKIENEIWKKEIDIKEENSWIDLNENKNIQKIQPKKIISLKKLKTSDQKNENESNQENNLLFQDNDLNSKKKPIISFKKTSPQENTISEATNQQEIDKIREKEVKKEEVLIISDWDTNCNIIKEEKSEIFWNYKWSFIEDKEYEETKIDKIQENKQETHGIKVDETKTNLERYSQSEQIKIKKKQKRIIISSIIGTIIVSVSSLIYIQPWFIKSNLQEKTHTQVSQEVIFDEKKEVIIKENEINDIPPHNWENITNHSGIENSQIVNIDIVKEKSKNQVDNIEKSTKMDEKLQDYLLQKYKK